MDKKQSTTKQSQKPFNAVLALKELQESAGRMYTCKNNTLDCIMALCKTCKKFNK